MYLLGFSLNNLTLMALTVATGFVVDDAIVMTENIARLIEGGMEPRDAALAGSKQIGFTIVSLTLSLIAVLIPLLFMGDVVGRLFREFAITLAVAILISGAVSLSLAPMLCAAVLRPRRESEESSLARFAKRRLDQVTAFYGRLLDRVFVHQRLTLAVAALTLLLTIYTLHGHSEGLFSGAGYRASCKRFRWRQIGYRLRPWRDASRRSRQTSSPIPMSRACLPSSGSMAST